MHDYLWYFVNDVTFPLRREDSEEQRGNEQELTDTRDETRPVFTDQCFLVFMPLWGQKSFYNNLGTCHICSGVLFFYFLKNMRNVVIVLETMFMFSLATGWLQVNLLIFPPPLTGFRKFSTFLHLVKFHIYFLVNFTDAYNNN